MTPWVWFSLSPLLIFNFASLEGQILYPPTPQKWPSRRLLCTSYKGGGGVPIPATRAGSSIQPPPSSLKEPYVDNANFWCIVFFPVLKPLACRIQSRCLGWTYKLPGAQKFSIELSPLSVGFPQRRPLMEAEKPTRNPEIPKKRRVHANFFEKFARTFRVVPVTRVRSATEIVHLNLFIWTF